MSFHRGDLPVVRLLGPLHVTVAGQVRAVKGRKQQLLLARLVLADGKPVLIDTLIADLWATDPPGSATRALQVHVSRLRTFLQCPIENVNNVAYRLPRAEFTSDVREFLALSERGRTEAAGEDSTAAVATFETALGLWRGAALGDLAELDAVRSMALQLEENRNQAFSDWVEACIDNDQTEKVIGELQSLLESDPLQEHRWRQLIRALHRSGRHGEALSAYRQAQQIFIEELGIEPGRIARDIYAELQRADIPAPEFLAELEEGLTAAPATLETPGQRTAPLVGRDAELGLLVEAWRRSRNSLQLVCVTGEPGVGKSRLVGELATRAAAADTRVFSACGDPQAPRTFHHFAEILRAATHEMSASDAAQLGARLHDHLPSLARIAPEIGRLFPAEPVHPQTPVDHGTDFRLGDALAAWLEVRSEDQPLVLILDDMHWADAGTVQLLRHALGSPRAMSALIVVAMRKHHAAISSERGELDRRFLATLMRQSADSVHLPLPRLTKTQTAEVLKVESVADFSPDPHLVDSVHAASGGNPLFIVELARKLRVTGENTLASTIPAGVRQVIDERIGLLPTESQRLLRCASALGSTVDRRLLRGLAEINEVPARAVDSTLMEAVRAQVLEQARHDYSGYIFSHEIVRSTLYNSLRPTRRAALHGQIAALLESSPFRNAATPDLLAHHFQYSDLPEGLLRAAEQLLAAGRDALQRGAAGSAVEKLARGIELLGESAEARPHSTLRCDLMINLGIAQLRAGYPGYRQTLLDAADIARLIPDTDRLIRAVLANNRGWWSSAQAIDHQRVAQIETALALSDPSDPSRHARLLAAWALENVRDQGSRDTVLKRSDQAVALAQTLEDQHVLAECLTHRFAVLFALFEDPRECLQVSEWLLDLARRLGDPLVRLTASMCHAQASLLFGDGRTGDRYIAEAIDLARKLEYPAREWLSRGWRAARAGARGDFDRAHSLAEDTLQLGLATDQADAETWFAGQLFVLRFQQGRTSELVADLSAHVAEVAEAIPAWRAAMAVVLAESGQTDQALQILSVFASDDFTLLPQDILWLIGMSCLSIACDRLEATQFAPSLYAKLAPFSGLIATNGTIDLGPVDTRLAALARLSGDDRLAAHHAAAAVAQSHDMDSPVWAAEARELISGET